jgi:hypothetical protein
MSVASVREKLAVIEDYGEGLCFPLAIDAALHNAALPDEYYEMALAASHDPQKDSVNPMLVKLITNFFMSEVNLDLNSTTAIAHFNAYDACPQPYFADQPYEYEEEIRIGKWFDYPNITSKHLRLGSLLKEAHKRKCITLFYSDTAYDPIHVNSLQEVDPGGKFLDMNDKWCDEEPVYLIRENGLLADIRTYSQSDLWLPSPPDDWGPTYAPLPEIEIPGYDGKKSWELIILPPEPVARK